MLMRIIRAVLKRTLLKSKRRLKIRIPRSKAISSSRKYTKNSKRMELLH